MKNLSGQRRWVLLKTIPRKQDGNPKLVATANGNYQDEMTKARLRSETMTFEVGEILIPGEDKLKGSIFSADNPDKYFCQDNQEMRYFVEQNAVKVLPYTREDIERIKENWTKDPIYDLIDYPGADEYWDELKTFQLSKQKEWEIRYDAITKIAEKVAMLPVFSPAGINYELHLIAMIAAGEPDAKVCIEKAHDIIFAVATEQYNQQLKESKENERSRKLGPRKQSSTDNNKPAADNKS